MIEAQPCDSVAHRAQIEAEHEARAARAAQVLPANKTALFEVLAAAGIATVVVEFDGYGDSGQIEDIVARRADGDVIEPPTVDIEIASPTWDGAAIECRTLPLAEALETLVYDFLRETHPGWENNDGVYGEFTLDVASRSIGLDHNSRYTEVETSAHEW